MLLYIHKVHNNVNVYTHKHKTQNIHMTTFNELILKVFNCHECQNFPNCHKSDCPTALIALIKLFWNGIIYHLFVKTFTS